jgi:hypothetical protein
MFFVDAQEINRGKHNFAPFFTEFGREFNKKKKKKKKKKN